MSSSQRLSGSYRGMLSPHAPHQQRQLRTSAWQLCLTPNAVTIDEASCAWPRPALCCIMHMGRRSHPQALQQPPMSCVAYEEARRGVVAPDEASSARPMPCAPHWKEQGTAVSSASTASMLK